MDEADRADQRIENTVADAIASARMSLGVSLKPIGSCHFCGSEVKSGRVFCDDDCLKDYRHEEARRKAIGL